MKKQRSPLDEMFGRFGADHNQSCSEKALREKLRQNQPEVTTQKNSLLRNAKNRQQGAEMEAKLAMWTGLDVTPGSGCGFIFKGDLNSENWLIEVKSTRQDAFVFDSGWLSKTQTYAKEKGKDNYAVLFGWDSRPEGYDGELLFAAVPLDIENPIHVSESHHLASKTAKMNSILRTVKAGQPVEVSLGGEDFIIMTLNSFLKQCLNQS